MILAAEVGLRLALRRARGLSREDLVGEGYGLIEAGIGFLSAEQEPDHLILRRVRGMLAETQAERV